MRAWVLNGKWRHVFWVVVVRCTRALDSQVLRSMLVNASSVVVLMIITVLIAVAVVIVIALIVATTK